MSNLIIHCLLLQALDIKECSRCISEEEGCLRVERVARESGFVIFKYWSQRCRCYSYGDIFFCLGLHLLIDLAWWILTSIYSWFDSLNYHRRWSSYLTGLLCCMLKRLIVFAISYLRLHQSRFAGGYGLCRFKQTFSVHILSLIFRF
jgi:hypothetical protein